MPATSNYLALRLNGDYTHDHLKRVLRRFDDDGLVPVLDREGHTIKRHVPVLEVDELRALERRLGVKGKRTSNIRAARRVSGHYSDHLYEMLSDDEKIAAWGGLWWPAFTRDPPAPKPARKTDRLIRYWGVLRPPYRGSPENDAKEPADGGDDLRPILVREHRDDHGKDNAQYGQRQKDLRLAIYPAHRSSQRDCNN